MDPKTLNKALGNIDLYLLDQILKDRYNPSMKVLDAGCGEGRNLTYFLKNGYEVYGLDSNPGAIRMLQFVANSLSPGISKSNFMEGTLENLPYDPDQFDLVICSAVLHFARDPDHFDQMFAGICKVVKPGGSLFIRTASSIGIEDKIIALENGRYELPDGSTRYLIHRHHITELPSKFGLKYIEPFKTVNVADKRCMSNLILAKL